MTLRSCASSVDDFRRQRPLPETCLEYTKVVQTLGLGVQGGSVGARATLSPGLELLSSWLIMRSEGSRAGRQCCACVPADAVL